MSYDRQQFERLIRCGMAHADEAVSYPDDRKLIDLGDLILANLDDYDVKNGSYAHEIAIMPVSPLISAEEKERKYGKRPDTQ